MTNPYSDVEQHGVCILPELFSQREMHKLIQEIEGAGLRRSKAGIRHALRNDDVRRFAHDPRLIALAEEILGREATVFRATLFDKSPRSNWLVVWHQDTALPIRKRHDAKGWGPWSVKDGVNYAHAPANALCEVLALRVHLDDSNAENGPLKVLPGTHKRAILTDDDIERLAGQIAPMDCLVMQGGVLAMRPLTVHASSKAHSEVPRRVLHIEYAACTNFAPGLELAIT